MWFMNNELMVWMVIVQTAFLFVPGLFVLSYMWIKHHETRHAAQSRRITRTTRHAKVT